LKNFKIPNNLKLTSTSFDNVYLIEEQIHSDDRGYFMETWNEMKYSNRKLLQNAPSLQSIKNDDSLFNTLFVQDNLSVSYKGVFRGLHYQCGEWGQAKLVRVIKGSVVDFIVDLREDSQTYGKFEYFPPVAVNIASDENLLNISSVGPNPFNNEFNVEFETQSPEPIEVYLYNIRGQIVYKDIYSPSEGKNRYTYNDNKNLPAGYYVVSIKQKDNWAKGIKLLKR